MSLSPFQIGYMPQMHDKKGENLPLLSKAQIILKEYDAGFEERLESWKEDEVDLGEDDQSPSRPLGLWYEFIEVCGGAGKISRELDRLGVVVGPVMDLSRSPAYDITDHKVLPWLLHLCENDRLMSFVVAPPCTSFSPAAYPPVRTYAQPRGLLPLTWKALVGKLLHLQLCACLKLPSDFMSLARESSREDPR